MFVQWASKHVDKKLLPSRGLGYGCSVVTQLGKESIVPFTQCCGDSPIPLSSCYTPILLAPLFLAVGSTIRVLMGDIQHRGLTKVDADRVPTARALDLSQSCSHIFIRGTLC